MGFILAGFIYGSCNRHNSNPPEPVEPSAASRFSVYSFLKVDKA